MTPSEIVEKAYESGVILYLESGLLRASGKLPTDWVKITAGWLDQKDAVIKWLSDSPSEEQRKRMVKVAVNNIKKRMKLPCVNLGELIEEKPSCGCGARHKCSIYGECVVSGNTNKWRVCSRCNDYKAE